MDKFIERLSIILNKQARHLTKVPSVSVKIGNFPFVACTDGLKIMISAVNDIYQTIKDESKEVIFSHFKGLNYHEAGHIIFSDFDKLKKAIETVQSGNFYPEAPNPETPAEEIYLENLKDNLKCGTLISFFKALLNISEDVWMELKVMQEFPGTKSSICFNARAIINQMPKYEDMKTNIEKCHNLLLTYARGGYINAPEEFLKYLSPVLPLVSKAVTADDFDDRARYSNQIILKLYPLIAGDLDNEDAKENMDNQSPDHSNENPDPNARKAQNKKPQSSGQNTQKQQSQDQDDSEGQGGSEDQDDSKGQGSKSKGSKKNSKKSKSSQSGSQNQSEENQSEENPLESLRKEVSETINSDEPLSDISSDEVRDLSKILKDMRKEEKIEEKENEIKSELGKFGVKRAEPESSVAHDVTKYVRRFETVLRDLADEDGEENELLFGPELDLNSLHRRDGKHFVSYDDKDALSMSIVVMIDESGSMYDDERYKAAEKCALTLYEFCRKADVPISVYGHHNICGQNTITSYAEFDSVDGKDKNRIHLHPNGCNDDAGAFSFAAKRIKDRPENIRLLVMISDGQPSCEDFESAKEKIQKELKELKKVNVVPIAAAIGDDKPNIKDIYGTAFVDMSDLNKFPQKMLGIIQAHAGI